MSVGVVTPLPGDSACDSPQALVAKCARDESTHRLQVSAATLAGRGYDHIGQEVRTHRNLRQALQDAEGFSDLVVVVFLDVRGFSTFAGMAESGEAALFLRRVYLNIVDEYFPDSAFFKPTGDGLVIVRHFDRSNLGDEVTSAISTSLRLVEAFPHLTERDPMVNFEVPTSLGVGIARGAATRLASGDLTLDYSGRPLNLAARLMDLARPRGVVFDSRLLKGLELTAPLIEQFTPSPVYLRGIAETESIEVYASDDVTIPSRNRSPLWGGTATVRQSR